MGVLYLHVFSFLSLSDVPDEYFQWLFCLLDVHSGYIFHCIWSSSLLQGKLSKKQAEMNNFTNC